MDADARRPVAPPPRLPCTRGRRRQVKTTEHCCPQTAWAYHGRGDCGTLRANGHPTSRRWRPRVCLGGNGSFLETHGTPLHGQQMDPDQRVWAIAALAEGLGLRAVARVFASAPHTGLRWLVEAADPLEAFSRHVVREVDGEQGQMDALCA